MISKTMKGLVSNNSAVRAMFEEGGKLKTKYGVENVYDFSLGNPNVPAPREINQAIIDILNEEDPVVLHGYMNNAGYEDVRIAIANSINRRFGTKFESDNLFMTVGAAAGLNIVFRTFIDPGDEIIVFAPYFLEYKNYINNYNGNIVEVSPNLVDFQPNLNEFEHKISEKTKLVVINTPNNPTGVIYSIETLTKIGEILEQKQKEFGHPIYILSDEPYRELSYDGIEVPFVTKYYKNTLVGYSYSKSLSLPGERIGYILVPSEVDGYQEIYDACVIANRVSGFVNAPSLMQKVVARCCDLKVNIEYYDRNRKELYDIVRSVGIECIKPQGAFYLFIKIPIEDEKEFINKAKEYNILMVPGSSFACPGYARLAYCVSYENIVNSRRAFEKLMENYK